MNDINDLDARQAGTFKIGGEIDIHRLGFGAMQITGAGVWGEPEDRPENARSAARVLEDLAADRGWRWQPQAFNRRVDVRVDSHENDQDHLSVLPTSAVHR